MSDQPGTNSPVAKDHDHSEADAIEASPPASSSPTADPTLGQSDCKLGHPYPDEWTFKLDERRKYLHPQFATPDNIDVLLSYLPRSPNTPPEVFEILDISCLLLRMSVVHYEFAAIAAEKSLQAVECSLRIRLDTADNTTFFDLIELAKADGVVTAADADLLHVGRQLRNRVFAHPRQNPVFHPGEAFRFMRTSFQLVTEIYEASPPTID